MDKKTPERLALEARATVLGVTFQANIGDKKLAARVAKAQAARDGDAGNDDGGTTIPQVGVSNAGIDKDKPPVVGTGGAADDGLEPPAGVEDAPADNSPPESAAKAGSAPSGADPQPDPTALGSMVTVIGPQQGRRRIGRRFGQEPVDIPAEDLSEEELDALISDPTLAVSVS